MLYVVKTDCQWRKLLADFPPWQSVHQQFRAWRDSGAWERVGKSLREQGRKSKGLVVGDHQYLQNLIQYLQNLIAAARNQTLSHAFECSRSGRSSPSAESRCPDRQPTARQAGGR